MKTLLTFCLCLSGCFVNAQTDNTRIDNFKNPPLKYHMNPNVHGYPMEVEKQKEVLDNILLSGYGGLTTNVNFTSDYLKNDAQLAAFFQFVRLAKERQMEVWLYDEKGYPSGMAGGLILAEHPDWEAEGLLFKDTTVVGGTLLKMNVLRGDIRAVKALPLHNGRLQFDKGQDLRPHIKDGTLEWQVPAGVWKIAMITSGVLYEGFQVGEERNGETLRYPSLLMPEVTNLFIKLTHQRYADFLKEKLGSLLFATFTDEPSTVALPFFDLGYGVYPWKNNVSEEFRKRYGYSLEEQLIPMMLDEGAQGQKVRTQYFNIIADFMANNYFRPLKEFCHQQGLKSGGHLLLEESLMAHVPLYGNIMACYRELDIPGIDVLTGSPDYTRRYLISGRLASSAAELEGNSMVMTEECPVCDWGVFADKEAPTLLAKGTLNRQMIAGIDKFNNYLQLQHEDDAGKKKFNEYIARVCMMMSGGTRASRIAVYYPIETLWAKFRPSPFRLRNWDDVQGGDDAAQYLKNLFDNLSFTLYDNHWEFSYIDAKGVIEDGLANRDVLILPGVETIPTETMEKIAEFCKKGGRVIAVESWPTNSLTDFPSASIKKIRSSLPQKNIYFEKSFNRDNLNDLLNNLCKRELTVFPKTNVLCSHKIIDGRNVYLIINDNSSPKDLIIKSNGQPLTVWNPQNGKVTPMIQNSLFLHAYESVIITDKSELDNLAVDVANLRCELLTDPQGIGHPTPRLSWEIVSDERDVVQTHYHVLVASSLDKLNNGDGDLWDSQKTASDASVFVPYAGKKLESRMTCFWKVKVTTNKGVSSWSSPASWSMALMNQSDWQARWIGLEKFFSGDVFDKSKMHTRLSARYFRKEFDAARKPVKATVYVTGAGLYELYINGKKIGDRELAPMFTEYTKVVKYNTFDVTKELNEGKNAVGVILGNGRYFSPNAIHLRHFGFPRMILQMELEYADGSRQTVVSDESWKVTPYGPIRANNEYDGEEYDATMEMPGWDHKGFDDKKWMQAERVEMPGAQLEAQLCLNTKVMETLQPVVLTKPADGVYILDMGQNMVGRLRLRVKGKAGDVVKLRFAETLQPNGMLYLANIRDALVTDLYTLKGGDTEIWEPKFTYHGFRFVEVTGYPGTPTVQDFEGKVMYDEMRTVGQFETSNGTINQIHKNAYWGIRGNYHGFPTDCPQRDERHGWLGDRAVGSHGESFLFDHNNLYAKWLDDIEQSQREDGSIPDVAPRAYRHELYSDNMTWPGTYLIVADMLYRQYGNDEPIRKHYESMKKWIKYIRETHVRDHIMPRDSYGDHCMPPESPELIFSKDPARKTSAAVIGTTYYYRMLCLLERFAIMLGRQDDAKAYAQEALEVKQAYNEKFFDKATAQYDNNTVTANLLSLYFGLAPEGYENRVFQNIVDKTNGEHKGHISTGLLGTQWLMRGLSDYGAVDLAFQLATNRTCPSWGYMIDNGATTIWELWNGNTADPAMNSHNHVMLLGDLIVWFYEYLAGIRTTPESAGFKQIQMIPHPVAGLDYVTASYRSVHGEIKSAWSKGNDSFRWNITIPCNTSAIVYIPTSGKKQIQESGRDASSATGVKFIKTTGDYAVFEIKSGSYEFSI